MQQAFERRGYRAHVAPTRADAAGIVWNDILPATGARSFACGGSLSVHAVVAPLFERMKRAGLEFIDTHEPGVSWAEIYERRRRALLTDLFFTGSNAITVEGQLVNLDAVGNRAGALTFGPRHVVVIVGRNKLCPDLERAMMRVKHTVAPANAARLGFDTPCAKTGRCVNCASPARICNMWAITERPFPAGRIHVVLVDEELGL